MLIREIMNPGITTISPDTKLSEAYSIMNDKKIRHLPVMEHDRIVGIVTDRDLRLATSKLAKHPFDPESEVRNIMSHPVQTTHPSDPVESATQIMREMKIGCLPVIEESKLVGMVTNTDLLDALLLLTGVHKPTGRLDIRLPNRSGELARLTNLIAERNVNKVRLVLRVGTIEIKTLAEAICNAGFEVIWPIHISCVK